MMGVVVVFLAACLRRPKHSAFGNRLQFACTAFGQGAACARELNGLSSDTSVCRDITRVLCHRHLPNNEVFITVLIGMALVYGR